MPRLVAVFASLFFSASLVACSHSSTARSCPSLLERALSPEELDVRNRLPTADEKHPRPISIFEDITLSDSEGRVVLEKWNAFLLARKSSVDLESQAFLRVWRRYLQAIAKGGEALQACKAAQDRYSGAWVEELRKEVGESTMRQNAEALRYSVGAANLRAERRCTAQSRGELLQAEADYHVAVEEELGDAIEFLTSSHVLPADKTAAIIHRAELYASVLRKTAIARMVADGHDLAMLEAKAAKLPPNLAEVLARQTALSSPFKLTRALDDLKSVTGE